MMRRLGMVTALALVVHIAGLAAGPSTDLYLVDVVAESTDTAQTVLITSSAPASYSTRKPDPLTVLVTLRNVAAGGVASRLHDVGGGPVDSIDVVDTVNAGGVRVAQVRIGLARPAAYEVRVQQQTLQVRFTKAESEVSRPATGLAARPDAPSPVAPAVGDAPATPASLQDFQGRLATAILSIEAAVEPDGLSVTLHGNGVLAPAAIHEPVPGASRLVLEFPALRPEAAPRTRVGVDPVDQVRVGLQGDATLVVFDLVHEAVAYRFERSRGNPRALRVLFRATPSGERMLNPVSVVPVAHVADLAPSRPAIAAADPSTLGPIATVADQVQVAAAGRVLVEPLPADLPPIVRERYEIHRIGGPASLAQVSLLTQPALSDLPPPLPPIPMLTRSVLAYSPGNALGSPSMDDLIPPVAPFDLDGLAAVPQVVDAGTALAPGAAVVTPTLDDLPRYESAFVLDGLSALSPVAGYVTELAPDTAMWSPSLDDLPRREAPFALDALAELPRVAVSGPGLLVDTPMSLPSAADLPTAFEAVVVASLEPPSAVTVLSVSALTPPAPAAVALVAAVEPAAEPEPELAAVPETETAPVAELAAEAVVEAEPVAAATTEPELFTRLTGSGRAAAPRAGAQPTGQNGQRFTGDPISMDFQNTDLRAVLRVFADVSGLNLVIDPSVQGEVNVNLTQVPWDQAFEIILRANGLDYELDGTIVRIASVTQLQQEAQDRALLAQREAEAGELVLSTFTLSYARADELVPLITSTALSPRGEVFTDARTNTLIVRDLEERVSTVRLLLDTLDRAEPQVEIEARIVQAGVDSARALGVQWGVTGRASQELGNSLPFQFPNRGGVTGRAGSPEGQGPSGLDARALPEENAATAVNLGVGAATSALGLTMGSVNGGLNLDVVLSALESQGELSIISSPRVVTQNNVAAEIVQGDQIPYQTVANNTVTVQFKDASLILRVTPQITAANTVIMEVELDNDFADFGRALGDPPIPSIVTQRARTTIQVADGETTVIGGIYENTTTQRNNRTPMLHRIPLLGWLFKSTDRSESTDELLIFLTPRIVPE